MKPNCSAMFGGCAGIGAHVAGLAHADHEDAVGAEVDRRRERRRLPHRAVAVVRARHRHGRKQQRDRRARHQVIDVERRCDAAARGALPGHEWPRALDEGDGLAASRAKSRSPRASRAAPAAIARCRPREVDVLRRAARAAANCRGAPAASAAASRRSDERERRGAGPSAACRGCRRGTPGRPGSRPRPGRAPWRPAEIAGAGARTAH